MLELKATYKIPEFFMMSTSVIIFYLEGFLRVDYSIAVCISMLLGSYIGASLGIKKGNKFIKYMIGVVVILSSLILLIS